MSDVKNKNFDTLVLITGGTGFIGSHVADVLLRANYRVRVLDNLSEQVHGQGATRPYCLPGPLLQLNQSIQDAQERPDGSVKALVVMQTESTEDEQQVLMKESERV